MEIKTALASGIEITAGETAYDTSCKRVLSEQYVLAQILQGCAEEFRNYDNETIVKESFGEQMHISEVPVTQTKLARFCKAEM